MTKKHKRIQPKQESQKQESQKPNYPPLFFPPAEPFLSQEQVKEFKKQIKQEAKQLAAFCNGY